MQIVEKKIVRPRGTKDLFNIDSHLFSWIRSKAEEIFFKNFYKLIIFPTIETQQLFINSLDKNDDILQEMYSFCDKKGRKLVLRPEGTLCSVRLISQNNLQQNVPGKYFYLANMFRYERPQAGRYREFWQLGAELVDSNEILSDIQIIKITVDLLKAFSIENFTLSINYLGNIETKKKYQELLNSFFEKKTKENLCSLCKQRIKKENGFIRILDCIKCKKKYIFPSYSNVLQNEEKLYLNELKELLNKLQINFLYDEKLVRGMGYYTGLVFEIYVSELSYSIAGGGRYNSLFKQIDSKKNFPCIGFAFGIERLISYLKEKKN